MRILYVSQYFPPEVNAPASRVYELARAWTAKGHSVSVLTAFPNHPTGLVPVEYRRAFRRGTLTENVDGIRVVRTWLYPAANRSPGERIVNYASFCASAIARGTILPRPDVVIGTSPQLLVGLAAWVLAKRFRRPFVFEVRDLWPESLPASGVGRVGTPFYRCLDRLATFLYRSADLVVPVTEPFASAIGARAPRSRQVVIENGVDTELFRPCSDREQIRRKLGLDGHFVVSYVGTIGVAHGLETVVRAARMLSDRAPDVLFLLVGEGAERQKLEARVRGEELRNVRFVGQRPREEIPGYLAASDACLVLLRRSAIFETVLPSKMLEFMACARPVIVGVEGLAAALTKGSGAGICIVPEDHEELAAGVNTLRADAELRRRLGENGRQFVLDRFTREAKAGEYLSALQAVVA